MSDTGLWGKRAFADLGQKDGTTLTGLFACTYSISPRSVLRWMSKGLGERGGSYDSVQALAAAVRMRRLLESSAILFQEGRCNEARGQFERLVSACLLGVPGRPIAKGGRLLRQMFHPKIAVFTFADESFRIYFGSQNLVDSPCLEAGLVLEGAPGKRRSGDKLFLADLDRLICDYIKLLPSGRQSRANGVWRKLGKHLGKGRLIGALRPRLLWQVPGGRTSLWQDTDFERVPPDLIVSPWADNGVIGALLKGNQPLKLLTIKPTLDQLALEAGKFPTLLGYAASTAPSPGNNIDERAHEETSPDNHDTPTTAQELMHPHAKIYLTRKDRSVLIGSANLTGPGLGRSGRRNAECLVKLHLNENDFNSAWNTFPDRFHKLSTPAKTKADKGDQPFLSDEELLALFEVQWTNYPRSIRAVCPPVYRPHLAGFYVTASFERIPPSKHYIRTHGARPCLASTPIQIVSEHDNSVSTEEARAPLLRTGCQVWLHALKDSTITSICRVVPLDHAQWTKAYRSIESELGRESPDSLLAAHLGLLEDSLGGGGGDPGDPAGSTPRSASKRAWRVERVIAGLVKGAEFPSKLRRELLRLAVRLPRAERASLPALLAELARIKSHGAV